MDSSLGINNIALKHCTYNHVYCQVGKGIFLKPDRRAFYNPKEFFESVRRRLESIESNSSLLRDKKVRDELSEADFVFFKIDAVSENIKTSGGLLTGQAANFPLTVFWKVLSIFFDYFKGTLVSETMLVSRVNYGDKLPRPYGRGFPVHRNAYVWNTREVFRHRRGVFILGRLA